MSGSGSNNPFDDGRMESSDGAVEHIISEEPKRKTSRAGSRTVATLGPAQLARKRANDREAQRLARQRTREHIMNLENRIRDLLGDDNGRSALQGAMQRTEELQMELSQLRQNLQLSNEAMPSPEMQHSNSDFFPFPSQSSLQTGMHPVSPRSQFPPTSGMWSPATVPSHSPSWDSGTPFGLATHGYFTSSEMAASQAPSNTLPTTWPPIINSNLIMAPNPSQTSFQLNPQILQSRRGGSRAKPIPPSVTSTSRRTSGTSHPPSDRPWAIPLRISPATGPLDSLLLQLIQSQSPNAAPTLVDPYGLSLKAVVYPEQAVRSPTLCSMLSSLFLTMPLPGMLERAANLVIMHALFEWQIKLSPETFNALPDWYKPRASQVLTAHPIWVSCMPWANLRIRVIDAQDLYATEEFQHLYISNLNLNWPYRPLDALKFAGDDVTVSEAFRTHLLELANWSLNEPFARRYPELREFCRFTA